MKNMKNGKKRNKVQHGPVTEVKSKLRFKKYNRNKKINIFFIGHPSLNRQSFAGE